LQGLRPKSVQNLRCADKTSAQRFLFAIGANHTIEVGREKNQYDKKTQFECLNHGLIVKSSPRLPVE
jgi:hypothetical protein